MERSLFFFSSRRRHTRYWRDWSSDVCSSDLEVGGEGARRREHLDLVARPHLGHEGGGEEAAGHLAHAHAGRGTDRRADGEIGRAWCRERVEISVVAVSLKKKNIMADRYGNNQ